MKIYWSEIHNDYVFQGVFGDCWDEFHYMINANLTCDFYFNKLPVWVYTEIQSKEFICMEFICEVKD